MVRGRAHRLAADELAGRGAVDLSASDLHRFVGHVSSDAWRGQTDVVLVRIACHIFEDRDFRGCRGNFSIAVCCLSKFIHLRKAITAFPHPERSLCRKADAQDRNLNVP
jgi:hypothetical protein